MHRIVQAADQPVGRAVDDHQHLTVGIFVVHGRDQPAAGRELLEPGFGHRFTTRCGHDAVIGRIGRMAQSTVAMHQADVGAADRGQIQPCLVEQRADAFDRGHTAGQLGQHRRLVAAPGADLECASQRRADRAVPAFSEGKKLYIAHTINPIQNYLSKDTLDRYQTIDVTVYQENILHTKMILKEFGLCTYLSVTGEQDRAQAAKRPP